MLKKYPWLFNLIVIALCILLVGRAAASILVLVKLQRDKLPELRPSLNLQRVVSQPRTKNIEAVLAHNIFCSTCAPIVLSPDGPRARRAATEAQRSTLSMQLLATMVVPSDWEWTMAVVRDNADAKSGVRIYKRGDRLPQGGAIVTRVVEGRVYFVVSKRLEYLDENRQPPLCSGLPQVEPPDGSSRLEREVDKGVRCHGASCAVDKSLLDKILANTAALATWARVVPSSRDNKPNGFKLYAIRPGSIFAKIGMQNADLLKAINGLDISTPDKALEAYVKLKTASHLTVLLERHGENLTLDYQIR